MPRTVAVTGGTGLIGTRLLPALQRAGSHVNALTRGRLPLSGIAVSGDLLDDAALHALVQGADAVVHLAAVAHTNLEAPQDEANARLVNVEGTRKLLRAALDAGVPRFLFLSSAHVYAGQRGLNLDEGSPTAADTTYGAFKLQAEGLLSDDQAQGMSVTILRPCLVYGPGVRFNMRALIQAVRRGYFVHVRGARTVRSLASVDTVAAAILHLLRTPRAGGIFNVADREPVLLENWVDALAQRMGVKRPLTVPRWMLETLGAAGSVAQAAGVPAPFTRDSLRKLTTPFSLDVGKLAATGFVWPSTGDAVIQEMIEAELGSAKTLR